MKRLLFAVLFLVASCFAQTEVTPFVTVGGSFNGPLGYTPGLVMGGGLEVKTKRIMSLTDVTVDLADKDFHKSGTTLAGGSGVYFKVGKIFAGPGARCSNTWTKDYTKLSCRPTAGIVVLHDGDIPLRWRLDYLIRTTEKFDPNSLHGVRSSLVIKLSNRVDLEHVVGVYFFKAYFPLRETAGLGQGVNLRFRF